MTGLDRLREAAENATPGPWEHEEPIDRIIIRYDPPITGDGRVELLRASYSQDAVFVAAFNPQVALALVKAYEYAGHWPICPAPSGGPCKCGWDKVRARLLSLLGEDA